MTASLRNLGQWTTRRMIGTAVLIGGMATTASAQWTVVHLHPAGATESYAYGVSGGQQVGYAVVAGVARASLWTGTAASWVDLNPSGSDGSVARGVGDGQQVGSARNGRASLWSGSPDSWIDLHPAGATGSVAMGAGDGQQVGQTQGGTGTRAALWTGSAASWVTLHPAGANQSFAVGVDAGQQVGSASFGNHVRACLWTGSAATWVDLAPAGATSSVANGVHGGQQAGVADIGGDGRAGVWSGSPSSWVDLTPPGGTGSSAHAVYGGQQVGEAAVANAVHASFWNSTSASWVDLHPFLPPAFTSSQAHGVWNDGSFTYVVGEEYNSAAARTEAVMWVKACESVSFASAPASVALVPGTATTFSISVNGPATTFRWRRNGANLADGPRISGSATATVMISSVQASDEGAYDCVVTSACNTVTSAAAVLSCDPIILGQPSSREFLVPGLQLAVTVPASAPYSYRWRQDGQNLFNFPGFFSGATTRTLTLLSDDPTLEGVYDVVVTDSCGTVTSTTAEVRLCFADFDGDGDTGTDMDIESFFRCLGGDCCPTCGSPDFDNDGDAGTDLDIESFFRVLGGGPC